MLTQPYKPQYKLYNKQDMMVLLLFVIFVLGIMSHLSFDTPKNGITLGMVFAFLCTLTPIAFFVFKVMVPLKDFCFCRKKRFRELGESQQSPLL